MLRKKVKDGLPQLIQTHSIRLACLFIRKIVLPSWSSKKTFIGRASSTIEYNDESVEKVVVKAPIPYFQVQQSFFLTLLIFQLLGVVGSLIIPPSLSQIIPVTIFYNCFSQENFLFLTI